MSRWLIVVVALAVVTACGSSGSEGGFAALDASDRSSFRQPSPGDGIRLPADLGAHPAYRIEWWYLTANLEVADGTPLGLQWTQFRRGLSPLRSGAMRAAPDTWPLDSVWMAHAAVSFNGQHRFRERFARGGIGQADARAAPLAVWLDDWSLMARDDAAGWRLTIDNADWSARLTLTPQRAPVRHGDRGFSAKSTDGTGSMYFSYVDLAISGQVRIDGESHAVHGTGWFDREWSSQFLRSDQRGWDWMGLQLDNGARLMAFRLREEGGAFRSGTWIGPDDERRALKGDAIALEVLESRDSARGEVPVTWRVRVPSEDVDLTVTAPAGSYWNTGLYPYWESPVTVSGSHRGRGYLELTGYGSSD
ncbi:putative secreted hydrolase [Tamilnaduibacter salinus]|uniref:Putative secreted hydrolase n=1 Tax=Tamilnaduibacter salinus TaxID=1484056 RepID=A0A2U1D183_9GAMM|nr:lipocalin-like domain-containing protein [Tamilnaduibacter salinus]PVY79031.1 putative secreted hydrolase [Tamilnaduibacter salinus]